MLLRIALNGITLSSWREYRGALVFATALAGIVANYRLAPDPFTRPLAGLVITLEALAVLLLGAGLRR
jgi:hypothetical protein